MMRHATREDCSMVFSLAGILLSFWMTSSSLSTLAGSRKLMTPNKVSILKLIANKTPSLNSVRMEVAPAPASND